MTTVELAGVVEDLDEAEYHAHPALSSSQARTLLASPARYRYEREQGPRPPTRDMELGTCVHTEVFATGQQFDVLPGDDLRQKAVKDAKAEFEARGMIALKSSEYALVRGMADAVRDHPEAGRLLDLDVGTAEVSAFWDDAQTGVPCRARFDWLLRNGRAIVDLKTTGDASPGALGRHMDRFGYHIQAAWYRDAAKALGLSDGEPEFVWVFVEREPPHFVTVARLAPVDLQLGHELAAQARQMWRDCTEVDVWPGYPEHIITVTLPPWSRRSHEIEEHASW